jgi:predicted NBD/HSP70 family sugar kinase
MTSTQVGIDLGGTAAKSGRITLTGEILAERTIDPGFADGPEIVLDRLANLFQELGGGRRARHRRARTARPHARRRAHEPEPARF